jgi:transmembrane sensor
MMDDEHRDAEPHRIALDARDWLVRLTSGHVSDAELAAFHAWRDCRPEHRDAFERERIFWQQLQSVSLPASVSAPRQVLRRPLGRRTFLAGGAAAAAAATGLMAGPRAYRQWMADFAAPIGEQAQLELPDGSGATLNSGSSLRVLYGPDLRLVALTEGEAEFSVRAAPDLAPFRLAMLGGNTQTDGGRFSARIDGSTATVTVSDHEAVVFGPADARAPIGNYGNRVRIGRNQQTTYRDGGVPQAPAEADMELVLAWRENRIVLEGTAFSAAVREVGRYLGEPVLLRPGLNPDLPVSGVFSTREPFAALAALARTQGASVRRIPGIAIIVA